MINSTSSGSPVPLSEGDLQQTLGLVGGLVASRVLLGPAGEVKEIHAIASRARNPKRIIRDIETLLLVKHGIKVDYRKISLVQLADDQLRDSLVHPIIRQIIEEDLGNVRRIRVEIQSGGRYFAGEAEEKVDNPSTFRTAAKATIHSIEKLIRHPADIQVEHAETLRLDSRQVLIVVLKCFIEDREEHLVGACFVGPRPAESAVRATLDALNRRVSSWT